MNYYEHHIGDYAEATAHLTFVEDAAYSRMIRKYYATEKPLPADVCAVQRLLCARTKSEKAAVVTVLNEFFVLKDDGWHNARCDAEIARYRDGDVDREERENNQKERTRRHREERARLFAELKAHDCVPRYDIPTDELRRLHKQYCNVTCNAPVTLHDTEPVTNDEPKPAAEMAAALRKAGLSVNAANPQVIALTEQGVSIRTVLAAVDEAKKSRPDGRIALGYVVKILERWAADAKRMDVRGADKRDPPDSWWASDAGIDRKGRELGLMPRPTESYPDYKSRIFEELRKRREAAA